LKFSLNPQNSIPSKKKFGSYCIHVSILSDDLDDFAFHRGSCIHLIATMYWWERRERFLPSIFQTSQNTPWK